MCIINNPLCYEGILSRRSAFRITVLSKLLSVIRGQGSRGTLRSGCPPGLGKARGTADRRGTQTVQAPLFSDLLLMLCLCEYHD